MTAEPGVAIRAGHADDLDELARIMAANDEGVDWPDLPAPEATGFAVVDAGGVVAVGWARREQDRSAGRWLSHASIAPDAEPVRAAFAILRAAAGDQPLNAAVPGPHPALADLIERGARISGRDTFCATDPGFIDPVRILPSPAFL